MRTPDSATACDKLAWRRFPIGNLWSANGNQRQNREFCDGAVLAKASMTSSTYGGLALESLTANVTADEYELFAAHAGDRTIREWARGVLLQATTRRSIEEALLAEVLALRTIILNVHFALATGQTPNADAMQGID